MGGYYCHRPSGWYIGAYAYTADSTFSGIPPMADSRRKPAIPAHTATVIALDSHQISSSTLLLTQKYGLDNVMNLNQIYKKHSLTRIILSQDWLYVNILRLAHAFSKKTIGLPTIGQPHKSFLIFGLFANVNWFESPNFCCILTNGTIA